ncbi:MAG: hypothetical protein R2856_39895 [Caldilineaceae bacterium]
MVTVLTRHHAQTWSAARYAMLDRPNRGGSGDLSSDQTARFSL